MYFNVCVILKLPSANIAGDLLRNYIEEQMQKYDCHTKNKDFLKRKRVKISDYKAYYNEYYAAGKFATFDGWMDYVGCYKDEHGKWCIDVNPNGQYDFYDILGKNDGFIPTKSGTYTNVCKLRNILLRRETVDDHFVEHAKTMYEFMTWKLPSEEKLAKEFETENGRKPSDEELETYTNNVSAKHITEALDFGCDALLYGADANKAKYPTFEDYLEKCRCFVPYTYVCDGEWVERSKLFYFNTDETHKKIKDFIKDFHGRVKKILERDDANQWYAVAVDAHK